MLPYHIDLNDIDPNQCFRVDFIQLALEYKPLNLGQGLPDDLIPEYAVNALKDVATEPMINNHQYTRGFVSRSILILCSKFQNQRFSSVDKSGV